MELLCPWQDWIQASLTFCEEMGCSWIRQPANTWSNLAYTVSGFFVYQTARKEGAGFLSQIGVIAMILSFGSFFFHASSTFIGEVFDVGAMFIFANFAFALILHRVSSWDWKDIWRLFWVLNIVCIAALISVKWIGILLFTVQVTIVSLLEIRQFWRMRGKISHKPLMMLALAFTIAFICWTSDVRKTWICIPDNHIFQGHALWHLFNSTCFWFFYQFHKQISYSGLNPIGRSSGRP